MAEYPIETNKTNTQTATPGLSKTSASTERTKRLDKVVTEKVQVQKAKRNKLTDIFIAEDVNNVKSYIFMDVLVPAIKKAVSDIVRDGIDMILYGDTGRGRRRGRDDREDYRRYYNDGRGRDSDRNRDRAYGRQFNRFDFDDLTFSSKYQAELVRDGMLDAVYRTGYVTVGDMYDLADVTAPFTADAYGWMSLQYIEIRRVRDYYILQLPKPMPIDYSSIN